LPVRRDDLRAEFVGLANDAAALHAATGEQTGQRVLIVVTPVRRTELAWSAAELTETDDHRFVE
jgi:hypothetical protein